MITIVKSFYPLISFLFIGGQIDDWRPHFIVVVWVIAEDISTDGKSPLGGLGTIERKAMSIVWAERIGGIQIIGIVASNDVDCTTKGIRT